MILNIKETAFIMMKRRKQQRQRGSCISVCTGLASAHRATLDWHGTAGTVGTACTAGTAGTPTYLDTTIAAGWDYQVKTLALSVGCKNEPCNAL